MQLVQRLQHNPLFLASLTKFIHVQFNILSMIMERLVNLLSLDFLVGHLSKVGLKRSCVEPWGKLLDSLSHCFFQNSMDCVDASEYLKKIDSVINNLSKLHPLLWGIFLLHNSRIYFQNIHSSPLKDENALHFNPFLSFLLNFYYFMFNISLFFFLSNTLY